MSNHGYSQNKSQDTCRAGQTGQSLSHCTSPTLGSVPEHHQHSYSGASSSWSVPFIGSPNARYETFKIRPGLGRGKSFLRRSRETISDDEGYDMSLLKSAAPLGSSDPQDAAAANEPVEPVFDVSFFSGPMGSQDEEFLRNLQQQEANGKLTGGLGAGLGMNPNTRINGEELLTTSPTLKRSFSRSLSFRQKPTIKGLGQTEANKRGEVIEVIIEEPSDIDLSSMVCPSPLGIDPNHMRRTTLPVAQSKTEVFYPQPNWKPFSMRWPYLLSLILVSLGLSIGVELLCQKSALEPLMRFKSGDDISPLDYFVLKFVPTLITVSYGVLWQITDNEVKRLEAFYQMSKEGGALAAESINVDYITQFNFTRPFRASQRRHYAVVVSSISTLLAVSLVPTLGTACLVLNPSREERRQRSDVEKTIIINPVLSRLLSSAFVLLALLGSGLLYQLQSRRSGLLADVKGIAGLASMAVVSHIMTDFKDMDVSKPKDIHYRLRNHRYVLRNSSLAPDDENPPSTQEADRYTISHLPENPHPLMLRAEGGMPFIFSIALFLGFIPLFLFTPVSVLTDKAPWVVTALAVAIKLSWGSLETAIRMMEPYYILSKRHASAKTLTLDYTAVPFGYVALRALWNKHWMVALVGFGTVLAETLTIFVTGLATVEGKLFLDKIQAPPDPNHAGGGLGSKTPDQSLNGGQETFLSASVSVLFTVFILVYMAFVSTIVFTRRRHPFLPRQPNTIASVLAFMHQSKMLYDFVGTAKFSNAEMVRKLEGIGKTYGLGWFEGRDGQTHCGVDEEELTGSYKHGIDYSQGNKPWDTEWQTF
ncbi:uncharacterized protein BCR38DRAFT_457560 [Pseudomassariella vexata]|uniref:Spray n=1 Tax=Pseudomassariella vexata TaxID=1141098 RepID=A0A1Y2E217_9PEZI|nr:uncharacterized protein BCR38DRAFT_457560 [Pseudomassariella vexata]ORY65394.1 hypothetical protein BCR38DRAFT_457560 [Pseudomassariella vexata]